MNINIHAYSDADFTGDTEDRKSTGGYIVKLGHGTISWQSYKEPTAIFKDNQGTIAFTNNNSAKRRTKMLGLIPLNSRGGVLENES